MTGTLEEFDIASRLHREHAKPTLWVYFRKPTSDPDAQLQAVLAFRKQLEEGRQLFFREYHTAVQWEKMLRQHLVAYLDGMKRAELDDNFTYSRPEHKLLDGRFQGDGIYRFGTRMQFLTDLDGDGRDETVTFWFSQSSYKLAVTRFDSAFYVAVPFDPEGENHGRIVQVSIKDVTNDGLPEVLVAFGDGLAFLRVLVFGFNDIGRKSREITNETFGLIDQFEGQTRAVVHEGGRLVLPYGSQGMAFEIRWTGEAFEKMG